MDSRQSGLVCKERESCQCLAAVADDEHIGYHLARMPFEIILAPGAAKSLRHLSGHHRAWVVDALERHLRHEPTKTSRSRIKQLRGISRPQFRLRVGAFRVFYDVTKTAVEILAIVSKAEAQNWLDAEGTPAPHGGAGHSEG